ncbi:MAG: Ppx/GppA family phosphatase, partial [Pyrinomonadaceae bacterium]
MKTQKIAAIDIGSNSIKLAIIEAAASDSFTVISQERERVRLGEETLRKHFLSPDAIARSTEAIAKFRSIAESRQAETILAVATASVREANNAADFVREVEVKTGVRVEVLSAIEEARLIGIAAAQSFNLEKGVLLNIDIGGGSTELSLMRD